MSIQSARTGCARSALPERLTRIDDSNRREHHFLTPQDRCLFLGDFYARAGWTGGSANQLIANFKRPRLQIEHEAIGERLRRYREQAIGTISATLRRQFTPEEIESRCTFVPIPTSKRVDDPEYCDRLERTLRRAFDGHAADIRLLLQQTVSTVADHGSADDRISYERLLEITTLDPRCLVRPLRSLVVLFDDVLTSGKHYKVAKTRLREAFPELPIVGVFVARRVHTDERAQHDVRISCRPLS
jgi:hypothetical protein